MNPELARFNMVEQQIRTWDVLDTQVLDLLFAVKREEFVPTAWRSLAFADLEIPLGDSGNPGQKMWPPKLEARVIQDLHLQPTDEVLEIGTGSGYLTALLSRRAQRVTSVEIDAELANAARGRLAAHSITNALVETGDGARGWRAGQLFDVIVLVVLTVGALFVPLWMGMAGAAKTVDEPVANATWEALGQNAAQAAKYEALGYTPESAHDLILARFDYSFSVGALITMIAVILLYYFLILRFSEVEYREVISEKFGE